MHDMNLLQRENVDFYTFNKFQMQKTYDITQRINDSMRLVFIVCESRFKTVRNTLIALSTSPLPYICNSWYTYFKLETLIHFMFMFFPLNFNMFSMIWEQMSLCGGYCRDKCCMQKKIK